MRFGFVAATSLWKASEPGDERSDGGDLVAARYRTLLSFSQEAEPIDLPDVDAENPTPPYL